MIHWRWSRWGLLSVCCATSAWAAEGDNPADLFTKLDKNQDGQVTADELTEDQKSHFERLLRRGDKDANQSLSKDEFAEASKPEAPPEAAPGGGPGGGPRGDFNPGAMFERLDANKDGKLSKSEIPEQMPGPFREGLMKAFEKAGKDELTREDMLRSLGEAMQGRAGGGPGGNRGGGEMLQRLKSLDKNNDGKVTRDEFPAEGKERMEGLLRMLGSEEIDLKKAEEMGQRMGRSGEGRPPEGRPEGRDRRPEGDAGPRGEGRPDGPPPPREDEGRGPEGRPDGERMRQGDRPGPRGESGPGAPGGRGPEGFGPDGRGPMNAGPGLMHLLDGNHDGRLSREEFSQAATYFADLDRNRDGHVDPMELMGPAPFMGPNGRSPGGSGGPDGERMPGRDQPGPRGEGPGPGRLGDQPGGPRPEGDGPRPGAGGPGGPGRPGFNPEEMWKRLDQNGDGGISKDEAPEFLKGNFDETDANKDGKLDREEMRSAAERRFGGRGPGGPGGRRPEGGGRPGEGQRPRRPEADGEFPADPKPEPDKPAEPKV